MKSYVRLQLAWTLAAVALLALGCEPEQYCTNMCRFAYDGQCDDGRPSARAGSGTGYCAPGTDCTDCGPNTSVDPGFQLDRGPAPTLDFDYHDAPGEAPPGLVLGDTCGEGAREVCDDRNKLWRTNDGCTWGWYQCPANYPWEAPYRYECREDGPNGIGCYLEGAIPGETHWERCEREGSCTCEDGTRQGEAVEHCHRRPVFLHPSSVASCTTWYQVQDQRHECGTWQCSPPSAPPACNLEIATVERLCGCGEVPPPPPLTPACQAAIDMLRETYRSTSVCAQGCLSRFLDCAARSDCRDLSTTCSSSYESCVRGCT